MRQADPSSLVYVTQYTIKGEEEKKLKHNLAILASILQQANSTVWGQMEIKETGEELKK